MIMANKYEKDLTTKSSPVSTDYLRLVGASDNVSYKSAISDVAKAMITIVQFTISISSVITDAIIKRQEGYYIPQLGIVFLHLDFVSPAGLIPPVNAIVATVPSEYNPSSNRNLGLIPIMSSDSAWNSDRQESAYIDSSGNIRFNNFIYGNKTVYGVSLNTFYLI